MSGRGTAFSVIAIDPATTKESRLTIEAARHSPLRVVKNQLAKMLQLGPSDVWADTSLMSLVLQTEEGDGVLLADDSGSIADHGIRHGSTVWLSLLSKATKRQQASPPVSPVTAPHSAPGGAPGRAAAAAGAAAETAEGRARRETKAWLAGAQWRRPESDDGGHLGEWQQWVSPPSHGGGSSGRKQRAAAKGGGAAAGGGAAGAARPAARNLVTPIQPRAANHSYNGVVFDVRSAAPYEVVITSIHLGGMLGQVRVFASGRDWHRGEFTRLASRCGWNNSNNVLRRDEWELVGSKLLPAAWDGTRELKLRKPIRLLPGQTRGVYLHSGLPDDLGIQYQSYGRQDDVVAQDSCLTVLPGIGHTGSEPFEHYHGWFRAIRGPAGTFSYTAERRTWQRASHHEFPRKFKKSIRTVLLCHMAGGLRNLPLELVFSVLEKCDWTWFDGADGDGDDGGGGGGGGGAQQRGWNASANAASPRGTRLSVDSHSAGLNKLVRHRSFVLTGPCFVVPLQISWVCVF
eukprot:SAG22_NODE_2006_length_3154_cov_5.008183_1_plen_516_part_00